MTTPTQPPTWDEVTDTLADTLRVSLDGLVDAGAEDLRRYAKEIAKDATVAIRTDREDLKRALVNQAKILAEIHRVRFDSQVERFFERVLDIVIEVGVAFLKKV